MRCLILLILLLSPNVFSEKNISQEKTVYIYQDADLSNHIESSEAIQKGIEVAFAEVNNQIAGYQVKFNYLDHRGNVVRSKANYQKFINDPQALAIFSGIHSPPLISNRAYINQQKALTLVPWAAGGPITRYPSKENWIFRLSIDDTQAGEVIIDYAIKNKACKNPHLLLEETPWGNSNLASMSVALKNYAITKPHVTRFSWNLPQPAAAKILQKIIDNKDDCVVLVSNAVEGKVIAQAMLDIPIQQRIPIISHWGITGGDFHKVIDAEKRKQLDLHFIQSCFAFTNQQQSPLALQVFKQLKAHTKNQISKPEDLKSAVGFIHAYDLTKVLIQAIKQAGLSGNIFEDRNNVRIALENLHTPVKGLVKNYHKPFTIFDQANNPNAHEALGKENYCMGKYGELDQIILIE